MLAPLLATLLATLLAPSASAQTRRLQLVAKHGDGALYRCGEQRVLVLRGSPEQMGRQHGKLLANDVRTVTVGTLAWVARRGLSRAALQSIAGIVLAMARAETSPLLGVLVAGMLGILG